MGLELIENEEEIKIDRRGYKTPGEATIMARAMEKQTGNEYGIKFNPDTKRHEVALLVKPYGTQIELPGGTSVVFQDDAEDFKTDGDVSLNEQ